MNKCKCGCGQDCKKTWVSGHNTLGSKHSEETKEKIRQKALGRKRPDMVGNKLRLGKQAWSKGKTGVFSKEALDKMSKSSFKGGNYIYWHTKAWKLFGKDHCEICGMTNKEYKSKNNRRLSMHCRDSNNYKDLSNDNWVTVCEYGCHQKMDKLDR